MKLNKLIGQALGTCMKCNVPLLIMSSPGMGKTSTIELYCKEFGINLTTLIASQYAPDDILGLQSVKDGKLVKLTPMWFDNLIEGSKNGKPNLLFIDELSTCDSYIQAPLLNLIFNKSLGGHELPDNTYIIAAGNYIDELDNAFSMNAPLVNRFLILNLYDEDINLDELTKPSDNRSRFTPTGFKGDPKEFLGLNNLTNYDDTLIQSIMEVINRLASWKVKITNSSETGLIGFTSIRSISNITKFLHSAVELGTLNEESLRIVIDTLGESKGDYWNELKRCLSNHKITINEVKDIDFYILNPSEVTEAIYDGFHKEHSQGRIGTSKMKQLQSSVENYLKSL